jgi:Glyoxalase-like domain
MALPTARLELDHVLLATDDLEAAARDIEARHGLVSVEGGRHPGWGTANRIIPLGETYLELIAVVDREEAAGAAFGTWVAGAAFAGARPLGWVVRTTDIDATARRLGLEVAAKSRTTADGRTLRWRVAGIEQAAAEPCLPFFVQWGQGTPFPGRAGAPGASADARIARLQLHGDEDRLAAWLGEHDLPLAVGPGEPALRSVVLESAAGELVLDGSP